MTNKQRVLKIYPNAQFRRLSGLFGSLVAAESTNFPNHYDFAGVYKTISEKMAWTYALQDIQREMLNKLQD